MSAIGVLALQGAFREHEDVLSDLGAECFEIRKRADLDRPMDGLPMDGLMIPGGESTVMGKLIRDMGMAGPLRAKIEGGGMPVLGTCAGMILLAEDVVGGTPCLRTMPVTVRRNAYGRQLGSFSARGNFCGREIPLEFGEGVSVLCEHDGLPVAVRYGNQIATAFHPELTDDRTVHSMFLGEL